MFFYKFSYILITLCIVSLNYSFYIEEEKMNQNKDYLYNDNNLYDKNYDIEYIDQEQDQEQNKNADSQNQLNAVKTPLNNQFIFNVFNQTINSMDINSAAFVENAPINQNEDENINNKRFDRNNDSRNKSVTKLHWTTNLEESQTILSNTAFYIIVFLMALLTILFVSIFVFIVVKK